MEEAKEMMLEVFGVAYGQVLTSPFDIDHLNPVLLSYDWYLR